MGLGFGMFEWILNGDEALKMTRSRESMWPSKEGGKKIDLQITGFCGPSRIWLIHLGLSKLDPDFQCQKQVQRCFEATGV